jgi:hypothetical protein
VPSDIGVIDTLPLDLGKGCMDRVRYPLTWKCHYVIMSGVGNKCHFFRQSVRFYSTTKGLKNMTDTTTNDTTTNAGANANANVIDATRLFKEREMLNALGKPSSRLFDLTGTEDDVIVWDILELTMPEICVLIRKCIPTLSTTAISKMLMETLGGEDGKNREVVIANKPFDLPKGFDTPAVLAFIITVSTAPTTTTTGGV